jgi:predicted transcriptional regulator
MATLTLRIPDDLDKELDRQSAASHQSKSDLAREALRRYLQVSQVRVLRDKLAPRARALGLDSDEDIFRALDAP